MSNLGINSYSFSQPIVVNKSNNIQVPYVSNAISSDKVEFCGKAKGSEGTFADKKFSVECSEGLTNRKISGTVDDMNFNIKHSGKFFKNDTLTGNIGDKALNLEVKEGLFKSTISGKLGEQPVDLKITDTLSGYRIKGNFKDKNVDIKLNSKFFGYGLESENMSLSIKGKSLFGNDVNVKGRYNEDPELIPILMDIMYCLEQEELAVAMMM